jgi:1,2-diacylglycerol 3-beta-galactosyltransferase
MAGLRARSPRVMTDWADFPPHFWIESGLDLLITASEAAVRQAGALGLSPDRVHRVSGMLLHPRFARVREAGLRDAVRHDLGIPPETFVLSVLFGGKGSAEMEPLCARLLAPARPAWHVVALCGDNPSLRARLEALARTTQGRLHPLGFTDRVSDYLAASDLLLTKPGPGSLAEAFHMKVPVIAARDRYTVPQERFNARMVQEQGLGIIVRHWQDMPDAATRLARDPAALSRLRLRLEALPANHALEEVLAIVTERSSAVANAGRCQSESARRGPGGSHRARPRESWATNA